MQIASSGIELSFGQPLLHAPRPLRQSQSSLQRSTAPVGRQRYRRREKLRHHASTQVMLFDEPTSALDPEMIKEVLDCMIELAEEHMTMICVTHEMGFARTVADRVVFMADGEIVEIAPPAELFDHPQHERTRQFLAQIIRH